MGVAIGTVVAGNVGTSERYEYTVIGDPVNEASRLTELAKKHDGRVLASEETVVGGRRERSGAVEAGGEHDAARPQRANPLAEPERPAD